MSRLFLCAKKRKGNGQGSDMMTKKGGIAYEMCEKEITMSINGNGICVWNVIFQNSNGKIKKGSVF